jgi:hypothetical protein
VGWPTLLYLEGSDAQTERAQQWHRFTLLKICEV